MINSFDSRAEIEVDGKTYEIFSCKRLESKYPIKTLPFSLKILLENLLRCEDGINVTASDIESLANWDSTSDEKKEIVFSPARVLMQDFTGVPAIVDLAAMRDAMVDMGGDPNKINPLSPAELVIDHSIQVDVFGTESAAEENAKIEFQRNEERYGFLRWGQESFSNFKVVPPDTGIVHQVNLEYLARCVFSKKENDVYKAYPDTVVGTDSHTTMINGLGVLGWGVGGIEAEAAMLGQPITMLVPDVVGFKLTGQLPKGTTATDLVLVVVEMLRREGVVGKFVEFFGNGLDKLPLADRATIANMAPEYGATCGIFPIDAETVNYLKLSNRSTEQIKLVESYAKASGLWRDTKSEEPLYSTVVQLDMSSVEPSLAGPKRPQDRIPLKSAAKVYDEAKTELCAGRVKNGKGNLKTNEQNIVMEDGAVVIAAITSCTNTSNPSVMVGAGILAKKANERGLKVKPWVKTSLGPGSLVVSGYLEKAGLTQHLNALGFHTVGYGCTTCIGNSGPLPEAVSAAIAEGDIVACSVLSGNRNFEGRVHSEVKMNFLASPPLVVAYAIAGNMGINVSNEPLGTSDDGKEVYLEDIWPSPQEIQEVISRCVTTNMFEKSYSNIYEGDRRWQQIEVDVSSQYNWEDNSTYIKNPPYFVGMSKNIEEITQVRDARVLVKLGDSITTDHISQAGAITKDSPAGQYLINNSVNPGDFNSYGSRRGNHEIMMRGTFANIRLRNNMAPGTEGGWTKYQPSGEQMFIYDAAMKYQKENIPLIVLAGKEYGTGSSRDWAAKGTRLLGVTAVIAESFERIHRSNLVGMGVLPLVFSDNQNAESLGLRGTEIFTIHDLEIGATAVKIGAVSTDGKTTQFNAIVRVDTPREWEYYQHGGILQFVLRQLAA